MLKSYSSATAPSHCTIYYYNYHNHYIIIIIIIVIVIIIIIIIIIIISTISKGYFSVNPIFSP